MAAAFAEPLRLLVTDVDMPGTTGRELARALGAVRPEMPVLLESGRPASRDLSESVVGRPSAFLAKPFTLDRLRDAVTDLVGPLRARRGGGGGAASGEAGRAAARATAPATRPDGDGTEQWTTGAARLWPPPSRSGR